MNKAEREKVLNKIEAAVAEKYFDPTFSLVEWRGIVAKHRGAITSASTAERFESAVSGMLGEGRFKGIGLLSGKTPITARNAINASFSIQQIDGARRWVFQDVLPRGVAEKAGVKSGDVLLSAAGKEMLPSSSTAGNPPFEMSTAIPIKVLRGAEQFDFSLRTGDPEYKDNPYSDIQAITASLLDGDTAYLRVSLFPGKLGIKFANELDELFQGRFASANSLIVDLRGNPGGGIGGLALMSYLTPEKVPVGYSRNRKMALEGTPASALPVFDRVPRSRLAVPALALKFLRKTSIFLRTEGLGKSAFRGRIAILVNEHSTGAAEMLAQFAQENQLATIVGTKTPGRLVTRSATQLGLGYRLVIPVAAYISAKGQQIEGYGITPEVPVAWSFEDAVAGYDGQLAAAQRAVR